MKNEATGNPISVNVKFAPKINVQLGSNNAATKPPMQHKPLKPVINVNPMAIGK